MHLWKQNGKDSQFLTDATPHIEAALNTVAMQNSGNLIDNMAMGKVSISHTRAFKFCTAF